MRQTIVQAVCFATWSLSRPEPPGATIYAGVMPHSDCVTLRIEINHCARVMLCSKVKIGAEALRAKTYAGMMPHGECVTLRIEINHCASVILHDMVNIGA